MIRSTLYVQHCLKVVELHLCMKKSWFCSTVRRFHLNTTIMSANNSEPVINTGEQSSLKPLIAHLDTPEFQSLFTEGLKAVLELFKANNFEIRLCGGAVRDLLLGKVPNDLDLATTATPEQMIKMFTEKGIRLISESGWSHGTVTCRIAEENFEITTLRIDRVTDGRHAKVEFTQDWLVDASRRDLTFNSLFMTFEGDVIDYFHGKEDLDQCRVRFVGEADKRIKEDYLRILRYFRFFGRIANENTEHNLETLNAIHENAAGLQHISGERIWTELVLILKGRLVPQLLNTMHSCKLFPYIGLPEIVNIGKFTQVWKAASHLSPHYLTPLAALFEHTESIDLFRNRVKCSNAEYMILSFIVRHRKDIRHDANRIDHYLDILADTNRRQRPLLPAFYEFLKYTGDMEAIDYLTHLKIPVFPVNGREVKNKCSVKGKMIGKALDYLFAKWKSSRYKLSKEELLNSVDETTNWDELPSA